MAKEIVNPNGKIIISKEVIATLAGIAATECFGVVGMVSSRFFNDGILTILGKDSLSKGVDVSETEDSLHIKINVVISYGMNVTVVAKNIIENSRYSVEKHTGLKVNNIEVNIQGVRVVD